MTVIRGPWKRPNHRFAIAIVAMMAGLVAVVTFWPSGQDVARLIALPVGPISGSQRPVERFPCQVAYVHDGDTLRCTNGTRLRLHAVAARETDETCSPGHPCPAASAASATETLNRLVTGKTLSCEQIGTSYNRVTAICWTPDHREVNCEMIRSGTTVVWDRFNRQRPICRT